MPNEMATRSLWRAKLALSATALFGGAVAATITTSEDPAMTMKLYSTVPVRLFRDSVTAAAIAFDYEYSLWGLAEGSSERLKAKREAHLRDGIHLSSDGSKIVAEEILKVFGEADWKPSLHWKSMPTEFAEDSPYDLVAADGETTLNPSEWTFFRENHWNSL